MGIRRVIRHSLTLTALTWILHLAHAAHAQPESNAEVENVYRVEFLLYRVALSSTPGEIEYFDDGRTLADRVEKILENRVSFAFRDTHLKEVIDFISERYEINIIFDNRVVEAPQGAHAQKPEPPSAPPTGFGQGSPKAFDAAGRWPGRSQEKQIQGEPVTDGIIDFIDLKNVTLREALTYLLRPLELDYSIEAGFIWITTPENLALESFGLHYRPSSTFTFRQKGAYVLYDRETVVLGGTKLSWSGKEEPAAAGISKLARSSLMVREGQEAKIHVGDSTPIQYFEPSEPDDGTEFVLRTLEEPTGLTVSALVTPLEDLQREADVRLSLSASIVGERAPLDGVFLNVGEPSVSRTEHSDTHRVALGRWASLLGSADNGSALLLLFRVSRAGEPPGGGAEHVSEGDIKVQYAIEAKFVRYRGRLNKEKLNSKLAGPGSRRVGTGVFRLGDGILPLRRQEVDFTDWESLSRNSKLRGFELISAPRITIPGKEAWAHIDTKFKVVLPAGSPIAVEDLSDLEQIFRLITPEDYQLPISMDQLTRRGIIVDVEVDQIPYEETQDVNGRAVKVTRYHEANTGILFVVGVDDSNAAYPPMLDIYAQVRMKNGETWRVAKSRDGAAAMAAAGLSFFDIQDRVEISEGSSVVYLTSLSEDDHYIVIISLKTVVGEGTRYFEG